MDEVKNESVRLMLDKEARKRKRDKLDGIDGHIRAAKEALDNGGAVGSFIAIQHAIIALDSISSLLKLVYK